MRSHSRIYARAPSCCVLGCQGAAKLAVLFLIQGSDGTVEQSDVRAATVCPIELDIGFCDCGGGERLLVSLDCCWFY